MVSPLWKACSEGDLQRVLEFLNEPSAVDIELKDHTGVTPLIEAVRNGHVEVVRVLLDKGADPTNSSSQGLPEHYTSDIAILDLLQTAQNTATSNGIPSHQPVYNHDGHDDPEKRFYAPPPPDAYTYYPTINPSLSTVNEAGAYYPPSQAQHSADDASVNGLGNLPPPEVARMIPCRYFPACRYGAQCIFAHPQAPYFQGPMPPVQFPPYDPMGNPYVSQYYPSPPSFQQPPGAHPMAPMSPPPGPPVMHARNPSEVLSPIPGHFSPNGLPPVPYGPMSPPVYSHPGQVPVPMPIPPMHSQAAHPGHQSPNLYNSSTSSVPPFPVHQDAYAPQGPPSNVNYSDVATGVKLSPENVQAEHYTNHPNHREGINHHRRGAGRRPSFGARKPPCAFFPAGRCKNGDECRFPHVLPDNAGTPNHPQFPVARGGAPRPRGPANVNGTNVFPNLEAKLSNMSIRDEQPRHKNAVETSSRSQSSDAGTRPKFQQGAKHQHAGVSSHLHRKASAMKQQQRVPNADEFPVLAGSTTPPPRSSGVLVNGNGHTGPTAAQVLQAPPPARKDGSKESSTRGTTPDPVRGDPSKEAKTEVNGTVQETPAPDQEQPTLNSVNKLPVMSFAAAAATSATTDVSKEVSVSA